VTCVFPELQLQPQTSPFPTRVKIDKESSFMSAREDYQNIFYM